LVEDRGNLICQGFRAARSGDIPWITASLGKSSKLIATEDVLFFPS
jgi:hypothetical protein